MTELKKRKSVLRSRITKILGTLMVGATLITVGGLVKEGTKVHEYPAKADKGYCTVMVYMDGSNLESDYGAATADLTEIEKALTESELIKEDVHIVVEAGGSQEWDYPAMKDKNYGRFCVSAEGSYDVEEPEARDMGEANTLADFINYGIQSYPAEHYGLILWNHGAGQIEGFGCDDQFNGSSLSLEEISKAMNKSAIKEKFEFVSMDACLMGNIELAAVLRDKTEYLIASEELEPLCGYDYTWISVIGEEMKNSSDDIGRRVGETMVTKYQDYYKDNDYKLTLSLIDLSRYDEFHKCFHNILKKVMEKADNSFYNELGKKRKELQGFGSKGETTFAEIVDLMELMEVITNLSGDEDSYAELKMYYENLIPAKYTKGFAKEPSGLSIYLPSGDDEWILQDMLTYKDIHFCKNYQDVLDKYKGYLEQDSHIYWHNVEITQKEIKVQVDDETLNLISKAYLAVFRSIGKDGMVYLISTDSNVAANREGYLKASLETEYWGLKNEILCLIEVVNTENYTEYISPVLYNDELCVVHISFSEDDKDGEIIALTPAGTDKQQYELKEGDTIKPLYPIEQIEENYNQASKEVSKGLESGEIYDDMYYVGREIHIDSTDNGDDRLMLIETEPENCMYGFMIQDTRQELYYTDIVASVEQ